MSFSVVSLIHLSVFSITAWTQQKYQSFHLSHLFLSLSIIHHFYPFFLSIISIIISTIWWRNLKSGRAHYKHFPALRPLPSRNLIVFKWNGFLYFDYVMKLDQFSLRFIYSNKIFSTMIIKPGVRPYTVNRVSFCFFSHSFPCCRPSPSLRLICATDFARLTTKLRL